MKYLILIISLIIMISCAKQEGKDPEVLKADIQDFNSFINEKSSTQRSLENDKFWVNSEYHRGQIKIYLYSDNRFYYELQNLGKGIGRWMIDEGILYLNSKHEWIPLNYEIFLGQRTPNKFYMKFIDFMGSRIHEVHTIDQ